jgi:hypothetical protein
VPRGKFNGSEAGTDPIAQNNGPAMAAKLPATDLRATIAGVKVAQGGLPGSDQNGGDIIGRVRPRNQPGTSTVPYNECTRSTADQ